MESLAHISLGPITLHFYGLMYATAAVSGYFVTKWFANRMGAKISPDAIADIIFWTMIGGVLGGRIFYVLVYDFSYFLLSPLQIFAVWNGGMSIHGGLLGGAVALYFVIKKHGLDFRRGVDFFMPALALGLAFGRLGNFVNGELPGRVTDVIWGMDFGDGMNRHPSSLYAVCKDLLLCFIIVILGVKKQLAPGVLTGLFFVLLGVFRFIVEFFREPDPQLGLLAFGLSMGQWLSFGVFFFGVGYIFVAGKIDKYKKTSAN